MVYRIGNSTILKASKPAQWHASMVESIKRHAGNMKRVAQDMDIGYSTIKRWIEETPTLVPVIQKAREDAGVAIPTKPARKLAPVRKVRRRRACA